jgi:alcohol dehydrogenase (cytochrome c)
MTMRNAVLLLSVLGLTAAASSSRAQVPDFVPVTDAALGSPAPGDWMRWRRDNGATGYSPLDQVTPDNVGGLRLAWSWGMAAGFQEPEPIVHNGVMYLPHTHGVVQALDARNGELIWEYRRDLPDGMGEGATRNLALYGDKLFLTTEDAYIVALDARTGGEVWEVQTGDPSDRVDYSAGPIAGDGKIFAGLTCGTGTSRACFLSAHDAATGEEIWRRESVAGPQDPGAHEDTWGGAPYAQRRKASFWLTGSYDPELGLVYWTTASAYPYPELHKGTGSGSLLYSNSILALDADTGAIRWFFQMQPRDNFDMDHQDNPILADVEIGGQLRKAIFLLGKPGILWALDRESGEYLWHQQLVAFQNLYQGIDSATGAITMNEQLIPREIGEAPLVCPGMRGGKLFQTNAYNPVTGTIYSPISNECTVFEVVPLDVAVSGVNYDEIQHMPGSNEQVGRLAAVSASSGELLWAHDQRAALGSVLTTAGGLVFFGDLHRYFKALDARTGRVLWETPLSAPVTGYPISYAVDGQQYVAVGVGGNTAGTRHLAELYPELRAPQGNNVLMVFALPDQN